MSENPGLRDRRFMLQRPDTTKSPDGSRRGGFIDVAPLWVSVRAPSGMASVRALGGLAHNQDVPVRYSLRGAWRRGAERGWRMVELFGNERGEAYEVIQVIHDLSRRAYTDYVCEVGARQA